MNIIFKALVILIFLVFSNLNATQKQTNNLAQISATSLYNIDKRSLQTNIKVYLENNPNLKALKIVETLSNESYISFYTNANKTVYNKSLPKDLSHLKKYTSNSIFENEVVGSVTAYYSKVILKKLDEKEVQWVKNNPLIKIAVVKSWMPFDITDKNGTHHGFHQDIVSLINQKLSVNAKLVIFNTWKEAYAAAKKGTVHSIFGLSWTKDREEKYFDYSTAYHYSPYNLIIKSDDKTITSLDSLKNKKVGVEEDTVFVKIISEKAPKANIVFTTNIKDSYENLDKGNIDTFVSASLDTILMKKYKFKVAAELYDKSSELFIGTNKKYQTVSSILQKGFNNINLKELNNLRKKWFVKYMNNPVLDSSLNTDRLSFNLTKAEEKWSENNSIIKLAVMNYWIKDDLGNSIHTDLIGLLNKYSNLHFIPIRYDTWRDGFRDAKNGSIVNGIMNLSWTKERENKLFYYSKPYYFTPSLLITKKSNKDILKIEDLKTKTVFLRTKSVANKTISEKVPTAKVINIENNQDMYKRLSQTNEADAMLDYSLDKNLLNKYNLKVVQNVYDRYSEVSIGVSHKQKELMTIINKIYKKIPKEELLKLQNKDYSKKKINSSLIKLSKAQQKWIMNNPKVKVIEFFDEPPFTLNKTQKEGYIYELLESIIHSTGLEIEYVKGFNSYGSMLESLEKGKVDILSTFPTSLDMGKDSNIVKSKSVLKTPFVLVGQSNDNEIESVEDLFGKKVAVVKGYVQDIYLQKFPQIKRVYVNNNDEGFAAIREGRSKYYINNRANTEYVLTKSFSNDLSIIHELSYEHFPPFSLSFAMNGGKKELVEILKIALDSISINTIKRIKDKWIINTKKGKKLTLNPKEREWIKNHKTIRVHNEKNWPPFNFYEFGEAKGYSIELMKLVAKNTGLKIEFITGPTWDEFLTMMKKDEIDVMINIVKNEKRSKYMLFTDPFIQATMGIAINNETKNIISYNDILDKKVSLEKGFFYHDYFKKNHPDTELLVVDDGVQTLQSVAYKKADATIGFVPVMKYIAKKNFITGLEYLADTSAPIMQPMPLRFSTKNSAPELLSILQKGLSSISPIQQKELNDRWLSSEDKVKIDLTQKEQAWIDKKIPIKYVFDHDWAPFEWKNDLGKHTGIVYDLISMISERTDIKFEQISTNSWNEAVRLAESKEIDMYGGLGENKERKKYMNFTKNTLYKTPYVFVVHNDHKDDHFDTFKSLKNSEKIAVVGGYTIEGILKDKEPDSIISTVSSTMNGFEKLANKEIDIFIVNAATARYYINRKGFDSLKIATKTEYNLEIKSAIRDDWPPEVLSIIDKTIGTFTEKELSDIYLKWTKLNVEKKTDWSLIYKIAGSALLLILFVGYWNRRLKKAVDAKTVELQTLLASFDENVIASRSDLKGRITYASKAFIEISGYSLDELMWKAHSTVRHPDTPKEVFKDMWKTIQNGNVWRGEVKNRKKNGDIYWVNVVITPELEKDGNIKSYSAIREDITSRKAVEELSANLEIKVDERTKELSFEKQKLQALFDNIPVPMTIFDNEKGEITFANQRCKDFLGYDLEDINTFEKWFNNVQPDPEYQKYAIALWTQKVQEAEAQNREIEPFELNLVSKDGETKVAEIHSFHLEDGSGISFLIDLTQRKAIQEQIESSRVFLNTLLDSQEQIIITTNGESLISANESFNKFYNIDGVDTFIKNIGRCICDTFDINAPEGYLQIMMGKEKWVDYIISNPNRVNKAIILKDGVNHTFSVTAAKLPGDDDLRSAVFTDITSLENVLEEVERINKHTQDSIEYASLIQHALIPSNDLFDDYFDEHLTIWQPKDTVGGDVYLFEELRDKDECLLMVIDCTGHGVPGAFVTMLVKAIERQVIAKIQNDSTIDVSPAWILNYLNKTMKKLLKQEDDEAISNAGLDAGVIYYNKTDNLIKYAGAEISLFYIEDGEMNTIKGDRHSIGYKKSNASFVFKDHYIDITSKLQFYITTDGYLDQNGGDKAFPLGKRKFSNILLENYQESFVDQKEILLDNLQDYQKNEDRNDDISVVGFSVKPENNKSITKVTKIIEHNWEI